MAEGSVGGLVVIDEFVYCVDVTCLGTLSASAVTKHDANDRAHKSFAMTIAARKGFQERSPKKSLKYKPYS